MDHSFCIAEKDIMLIPMNRNDNSMYVDFRNNDGVRTKLINSETVSDNAKKKWFDAYLQDESALMFSIYSNRGIFLGGNSIYNIDKEKRRAEYGRLIISKAECIDNCIDHVGEKATRAAISIAKSRVHLKSLYLSVWEDNIPAKRIYEKVGFIVTGADSSISSEGKQLLYMEKILV